MTGEAYNPPLHEKEIISEIEVYPNPASDYVTMNIVALKPILASVIMYNLAGQVIRTIKDIQLLTGYNQVTQETNSLPSGQYFLSISADGFNYTTPIIVN